MEMDLNKPANYIEKAFIISRSIEETNKATQAKLFHLLLIVMGAVFGWLLCYFFPLKIHHPEFIGTRHTKNFHIKEVINRKNGFSG